MDIWLWRKLYNCKHKQHTNFMKREVTNTVLLTETEELL